MLDFGYKLRNAQKQVLEFAAAQTEDIVPGFESDGVDFTGKGFLALPQVCYKEHVGGKTQSAHFEAGNWMSKMAVHPERNYDDVIKRTIDLKLAEDTSGNCLLYTSFMI